MNGHLEVVKYLGAQGLTINNLRVISHSGVGKNLDMVKFFISCGLNLWIHNVNENHQVTRMSFEHNFQFNLLIRTEMINDLSKKKGELVSQK